MRTFKEAIAEIEKLDVPPADLRLVKGPRPKSFLEMFWPPGGPKAKAKDPVDWDHDDYLFLMDDFRDQE